MSSDLVADLQSQVAALKAQVAALSSGASSTAKDAPGRKKIDKMSSEVKTKRSNQSELIHIANLSQRL